MDLDERINRIAEVLCRRDHDAATPCETHVDRVTAEVGAILVNRAPEELVVDVLDGIASSYGVRFDGA